MQRKRREEGEAAAEVEVKDRHVPEMDSQEQQVVEKGSSFDKLRYEMQGSDGLVESAAAVELPGSPVKN